ncbi:MAG: Asp-tRNA(Asn)/Glu-tRNA(Gln) amidotransferase subunit GatA [Anaerotignaceae bacterium]
MELSKMTALEIGSKIKSKELGVVEVTKAALENIEKTDKAYHAFVTVCGEKALAQAEKIQKGIDDGTLTSPLAGVPMAVKDNMCTEGVLTTCASKILTGFKPTYSSTAVRKLEEAGAVILGKLNMDEFAMGSTTETSVHGVTVNPWGENRAPGGSSGGSAVAVAADEAYYTLGSDTGGSIRQPAAFCGVTGLKPTYGTVSRYGLIAYASSLDQIGPIGKNVEDIAEVLSVISGHDPKDSTSVKQGAIKITLDNNIKGKKIGLPKDYFGEGLNPEVKASVLAAAKKLEELGAIVEEFEMPELQYAIPAYYIIACAEASSNLSRFDGVKYGYASPKFKDLTDLYYKSRSEGFGMEVKRRIMIGAFVLSSGYYDAYYKKALQVKAIIKQSFDRAFEKYDCILSPTAPTTALKIGENLSDPLKMYLGDIYTVSVNLAGLPSMVVPCGFDNEGLPIGLQLTGKAFSENEIMNVGYAFQQSTDYHTKKPVLKAGKEA